MPSIIRNKKIYLILGFALFGLFFFLNNASADIRVPIELVPCGKNGPNCEVCHLYDLAHNLIDLMLWGLATPLLVVALIAGGVVWLTSAGSEQRVELGKKILWSAVIGFLIAFGAWVIVNTILNTLVFQNPFNKAPWSDYSFCKDSPIKTGGPPVGVGPPIQPPEECAALQKQAQENPVQPSAELNALIQCASSKLPAGLLSTGNNATVDSVAICNITKADGRCGTLPKTQGGICNHTQNSCHYYGEAVDFNATSEALEQQLNTELNKIASQCNFGKILFECNQTCHTHVSTKSCNR